MRVIDLGVMLAGATLRGTDLRWTDLGGANLVRADLRGCNLSGANLSQTVLFEADLTDVDLKGTRLFYGDATRATPRSRDQSEMNFSTGEGTGAVVENVDFSQVQDLSEDQRFYCCSWGGHKTRRSLPGGCAGIENKLNR